MIPTKYLRFSEKILEGYDWKTKEGLEKMLKEIFSLASKNYREILEYLIKIKNDIKDKEYLSRIILASRCLGDSKIFYYELKERGEKAMKQLVETILRNYRVGGYI